MSSSDDVTLFHACTHTRTEKGEGRMVLSSVTDHHGGGTSHQNSPGCGPYLEPPPRPLDDPRVLLSLLSNFSVT